MKKDFKLNLSLSSVIDGNIKREWRKKTGGSITARDLDVDWKKFTSDKYLFTHCTIVASVKVEGNGYYIHPACSHIINANGNSWTNETLLATFRTFVGGYNYLEHIQRPELSKGTLLDAVIRPVTIVDSMTDEEVEIYYVDILVATDRKHEDLVSQIVDGEYDSMSMGCWAHKIQCSKCGTVFENEEKECTHLEYELGTTFIDENGVARIVSEICGHTYMNKDGVLEADPEAVEFFEASWVKNPAYKGAVINHFISDITAEQKEKPLQLTSFELGEALFGLKVADKRTMDAIRLGKKLYASRTAVSLESKIAEELMKR